MLLNVINVTSKTIRLPNRLRIAPGENRGVDENILYHADNTLVVQDLIEQKKIATAPMPPRQAVQFAQPHTTMEDRIPDRVSRKTVLTMSMPLLLKLAARHKVDYANKTKDDIEEAVIVAMFGEHD